jgi:hypothetical protein
LRLSGEEYFGAKLHHRDVVGLALRRLERDLESEGQSEIIEQMRRDLGK